MRQRHLWLLLALAVLAVAGNLLLTHALRSAARSLGWPECVEDWMTPAAALPFVVAALLAARWWNRRRTESPPNGTKIN